MFQAVIWDFGGVFTSSPFEAFARFERERNLPIDFIRQVNARNHLENAWANWSARRFRTMNSTICSHRSAGALGQDVRGRDILPLLKGDVRPEMVEALRRVHTRCKTGCITTICRPATAMRWPRCTKRTSWPNSTTSSKARRSACASPIAHLRVDGRGAGRGARALHLSRRSRYQPEARAHDGHDDDQGRRGLRPRSRSWNGCSI